jgi:hypothetical protein
MLALGVQVSDYSDPYAASVLFLIGTVLLIFSISHWYRRWEWRPILLMDSRLPYVEIRQLANAKGWNLYDDYPQSVNSAYYLEVQMQQAAVEGDLLVWGRKCGAPLGSSPLLRIHKEHFKDFTFHYGYLTRDNVENISTYTWKPELGKNKDSFSGENYFDLYVSKIGIKRLLRRVRPSDGVAPSSS